jgi:hypothetical protein
VFDYNILNANSSGISIPLSTALSKRNYLENGHKVIK